MRRLAAAVWRTLHEPRAQSLCYAAAYATMVSVAVGILASPPRAPIDLVVGCTAVIAGGAGSGIAELLASEGIVMPILHLGLPDEFQHHASREDLLSEAGLDVDGIRASVLSRWPHLTQAASAVRSA